MASIAEEIMTERVTTLREDAPLSAALEVMQEQNIRHLPVVRGDRLVGMLSDRDLTALGLGPVTDLSALDSLQEKLAKKVGEAMSTSLVTVSRVTGLVEIADLLIEEKIGAVPVTEGEDLVGIVSYVDVLRAWRDEHA
jgi:CBS domain-containing protein